VIRKIVDGSAAALGADSYRHEPDDQRQPYAIDQGMPSLAANSLSILFGDFQRA